MPYGPRLWDVPICNDYISEQVAVAKFLAQLVVAQVCGSAVILEEGSPEEDCLRNPSEGQDASICAVEPALHGNVLAILHTRKSTT